MSTMIDAEYLLATILSHREQVSFRCLNDIRSKIEQSVPVVIDVSTPAVNAALRYYPEVFVREEQCITRAPQANEYLFTEYFNGEFASLVSPEIHEKVEEVIKSTQ